MDNERIHPKTKFTMINNPLSALERLIIQLEEHCDISILIKKVNGF